ncbi:hypothetical protein BAE44_0017243 [Dichanthelium oligosanthes]|uniref:C2 domain-containing protein n=1 Tax=Dichanthelium oligosanthes TaxID=888268 RepID=A0A1E5V9J1_9POAL|nr:hypothetical protein BAE44_0017243 [Dichanthelium oligosanthes]
MEAPDEEAGLGLPEGERLLEVTLISAQGLKPPSGLRRRLQAYAVAWVDAGHKLQTRPDATGGLDPAWHARFLFRMCIRDRSRPVGSPSMFAVGVRRPSGRVHGLLNVAASLVAVPPSPAACHALRLSPAVSLSGLSVAPNPSRVLRVLNRAHPTPPPSPKLLTPKKQQMVVKPNIKVVDDGSDEEGDEEEARGMGGVMFCGPCVLPFPRKIHTSPSDENLQSFAGIFSVGLRHCRTEPSLPRSPCK